MGLEAEIDDKGNTPILSNLKDDVICSICHSVFEDPVIVTCCGAHFCEACLKDARKSFKNCILCRQNGYASFKSRFMISFLTQTKLICPRKDCNESIPYSDFKEHSCSNSNLSENAVHLPIKSSAEDDLKKALNRSRTKIENQKKQIASLKNKHQKDVSELKAKHKKQLEDGRIREKNLRIKYVTVKCELKDCQMDSKDRDKMYERRFLSVLQALHTLQWANNNISLTASDMMKDKEKYKRLLVGALREKWEDEKQHKTMSDIFQEVQKMETKARPINASIEI